MSCNQAVFFYHYNTDTHHLLFCGLLLCSCIPHDRSDISTALCSLNYNVLRLVHSHYSLTIPLQVPDSLLTDYYIINSGFFHIYKIIRSNSTIYTKDVRQENLNYGYIQRWIKENYWEHLKKARKKKNISQKAAAEKIGVSHSVLTPGMKMELSISLAALFQNWFIIINPEWLLSIQLFKNTLKVLMN